MKNDYPPVSDIRPEDWFRYNNAGFDMTRLETTVISSYKKWLIRYSADFAIWEITKWNNLQANARKEMS